jgi:hypothetical protein
VTTSQFNNIPQALEEYDKLKRHQLIIGVPTDDGFLQMIARVNEFGMTIYPKNGDYLAVPNSHGGIVKFKSVTIPPRAAFRWTIDHKEHFWLQYAGELVANILRGQGTAEDVYEKLGNRIASDFKKTIEKWKTPPNAPLTVANKGFNNPLIDTGKLRDSITYEIVKG